MRAEIAEQPHTWLALARTSGPAINEAARLLNSVAPRLLVFAARGSSDHAAQYGQYLAHRVLGTPAMLATPASITLDGARLAYPDAVMIALSQSGESPDLLATVAAAVDGGTPVIALTNSAESTLAKMATVRVPLAAGEERSVAATKTYTAELLALAMMLIRAAGGDGPDVTWLSDAAMAVLSATPPAATLVDGWANADRVLAVGRGTSMSSAKESALKLMETSAMPASGWSAADATHGPLGQVVGGTRVLTFGSGSGAESVSRFARLAVANGACVTPVLDSLRDVPGSRPPLVDLSLHGVNDVTAPLLEILPVQCLALEIAIARGLDPDRPHGLLKVTSTT